MITLQEIAQSISESTDILNALHSTPKNTAKNISVSIPRCSMRAFYVKALSDFHNGTVVYCATNEDEAGYLYQDVRSIIGQKETADKLCFFPTLAGNAYESEDARMIMRSRTVSSLKAGNNVIVITYPEAIAQRVPSSNDFDRQSITIKKEEEHDILKLSEELVNLGLERVDFVYQVGQFAVRGSIVDIFSYGSECPVRLDFFGDFVDSIREFDPATQLSEVKLEQTQIIGRTDSVQSNTKTKAEDYLTSYFTENTLVMVEDTEMSFSVINKAGSELVTKYITKKSPKIDIVVGESDVEIVSQLQMAFSKNYQMMVDTLFSKYKDGYKILVAAENSRSRERIEQIIDAHIGQHRSLEYEFIDGMLHTGFVCEGCRLCIVCEHEIFGRFHRYRISQRDPRRGREALTVNELKNLNIGDYVVHENYGIGTFAGLVTQTDMGVRREMVKIKYQGGDLLMVSLGALHKISKYRAGDGASVKVSKLGGSAWSNLKQRTKEKLKDIARDLIRLYALRKREEGYRFSPDSFLQAQLEGSFDFQDTPDQAKATADVKKDMESSRPMDRLVCGDVGFGKTEIAVRAAMKCVADGKQAVVLVPTTVLAFQHYKTFTRRMKDLPVKVEYLSRTRTGSETKSILKDLSEGKVDIIIGTHKLLSKTVKFHDIGLLIIDEEQKFGVGAKEKIKQLKVNVDTLTLTATPIPRTLQFSLLGARDLSVINTPPEGRYPVETHLSRPDSEVMSRAIEYELHRGGQVLYVNNNISELPSIKSAIEDAVPTAKVCMAHGRMDGEVIESVMLDFVSGDYDVLLSTSIIESGIDISNCNTIIINNAQNFGLSDLHQLRGRVGRSNVQAYCYLFSPPMELLSDESRKRLEAITTYTDLGSGLNIAMRDLDIRGAGNLLGAEQSGFIADLGYETYKKVLNEAMNELKSGEFSSVFEDEDDKTSTIEEKSDCSIEVDKPALLPDKYVENISERLRLYRELDSLKTNEDLEKYEDGLTDRFGEMPDEAKMLTSMVRLRFNANKIGFERLSFKSRKITGYFTTDKKSPYFQSDAFGNVIKYLGDHAIRCRLAEKNGKPMFEINDVENIDEAICLLHDIVGYK